MHLRISGIAGSDSITYMRCDRKVFKKAMFFKYRKKYVLFKNNP